jgi:hypothetical protein
MPEPPGQLNADLPLDPAAPFDAWQCAMHGLLSAYYEVERTGRGNLVGPVLARIAAEGSAGRLRFRRLAWWATGLAVAASVGWLVFYPTPRANATDLTVLIQQAAAQVIFVPAVNEPLLSDDPDELRARELTIADAFARRDRAFAEGREDDAYHAWADAYRRQRDIGRWDQAFAEMNELLEYARQRIEEGLRSRHRYWEFICLCDVGDTDATLGDYAAAREAYQQSIDLRKELLRLGGTPFASAGGTQSLVPLYERLSTLALVGKDMAEARRWHAQAGALLRDFYAEIDRATGAALPAEATLLEVFEAAPPEFRAPPEECSVAGCPEFEAAAKARYGGVVPHPTQVTLVRGHLYREARLRRVEGDYAGTKQMLTQAAELPYYAAADESRLLFAEPLEAARLAVIEGDYALALRYLDQAEANAGAIIVPRDPNLNKRPIGPLARAELNLLRGAALLGLDAQDPDARQLIVGALTLPQRLAEGIAAVDRPAFLQQFQSWESLGRGPDR